MKNRLLRIFISHSLPLLVSSVVMGGGGMAISYSYAARNSEREAHLQLEQIQAYYDVIIAEMDSLNLIFSTNPEIISRIRHILEIDQWEWVDANYARMIRSYISAPGNARPYIDSIFVYLKNSRNRVLSSREGIISLSATADTSWYDTFTANSPGTEFYSEHAVLDQNGRGPRKRLLRIYRTIYDSKPQPIGVIVLNLLEDRLTGDYPSPFAASGAFLVVSDPRGKRLLSIPRGDGEPQPDLYAQSQGNNRYVRFASQSSRFNWNYELYIPRTHLYRVPKFIGAITVVLFFLACVIGILLTYKTNQKETRFLKNVLDQLDAVRAQPLNQPPPERGGNLFDYLNTSILRTFLEQDYLRIQKEVMEYRALQMQINPHFLFNTLETINWEAVALLKGPNDISRMILLLSRILKYSMSISKNPGTPLEEEIEHTRYYLELQAFRFGEQFSVSWDTDPGLGNILVPRLVLQPILENSFNHGFRGDERKLEIRIRISGEQSVAGEEAVFGENRVIIEIEDNGEGIDRETLEQLNAGEPVMPEGKGFVGFNNTRKRIMLLYKDKAGISIDSEKGQGTKIRISLPRGNY